MVKHGLIEAAQLRLVPCHHLVEPAPALAGREPPDCELGRLPGPDLCGAACPDYLPGLHVQERVRCEVWTRVMGYHRPVSAFNAGKAAEHAERVLFSETPTGAGRRRPNAAYAEGAGHD